MLISFVIIWRGCCIRMIKDFWKMCGGRIDKTFLLKVGIPVLVVLIAAVVFLARPFEQEQMQLQDFRGITESEKGADSASSQFGNFLDREKSLQKVLAPSPKEVAKSGEIGYTPFVAESISAEEKVVSNNALLAHIYREKLLFQIKEDISFIISKLYE